MDGALDDIDTRLIALLRQDSSLPVKALAARLGVSIATVHRRRESLRERGVIRRFTLEVDPSRAGRPALFLVDATIDDANASAADDFKRHMRYSPDVVQCWQLADERSFVLFVALASVADYAAFARRLRAEERSAVRLRSRRVAAEA